MKITAAAMIVDDVVYTGAYHHNIINYLACTLNKLPITGPQGFIADDGKFYNRIEARKIAESAGQIKDQVSASDDLFSEMLWSYQSSDVKELRRQLDDLQKSIRTNDFNESLHQF